MASLKRSGKEEVKYADCLCGQKKNFVQLTSIGGEEAVVNEFPWTALLLLRSSETNRTSRCGGTLLSDRHVLTSAACLRDFSTGGEVQDVWDDITVVLGEHDIEDDSETITFKSKAAGIIYPKFFYRPSSGRLVYDVGLLTLETPIDFSNATFSHIRPICLGEGEDLSMNLAERTGEMAGWGATEVDYVSTQCGYTKGVLRPDSASRVLKRLLGLRFPSLEDCYETFDELRTPSCASAQIDPDNEIHICASSVAGDICNGDSGSGLVTLDKQIRNYIIIGVASLNLGCNTILTDSGEKLPSVFADIRGQSVMGWIEDQTTGATFCRRSDQVKEVKGVDGSWGEWSQWSDCSRTCEGGVRTRIRLCNSPSPSDGGAECPGEVSELLECNTEPCPVRGRWSRWSAWSSCTKSCGAGNQRRERSCTNPPPQHGGRDCRGENVAMKPCNTDRCVSEE